MSAVVIEEEAANLLYGERSGMVNASPVGPPLDAHPPELALGGAEQPDTRS